MDILCIAIALLLDKGLQEPPRFHPLVGFGHLAQHLEQALNKNNKRWLKGTLATLLLILPLPLFFTALPSMPAWATLLYTAPLLYLTIGYQSLKDHANAIKNPLTAGDLPAARHAVGRIVSRQTEKMDEPQVARATIESIFENGNDALFATLFWFSILGLPGALLFRLVNTLDAMWGYRTVRYEWFGKTAARLDDFMGYVPARLTALCYMLAGHTRPAWQAITTQAKHWNGVNPGVVMAAGAGAIGVILGGTAQYHGHTKERPQLGFGQSASGKAIDEAQHLVQKALWIWLTFSVLLDLLFSNVGSNPYMFFLFYEG
ncbi:adenosylcobinamide-phosphate synthase CbiB [Magnetococcus sp. PR-3]|uniref:adenosylcobinamide-phosphate synthase CbiB n=1 Tax=Magnetococcus sp. PR-3 TaxID=3120355 RepID=UPI002FCDE912